MRKFALIVVALIMSTIFPQGILMAKGKDISDLAGKTLKVVLNGDNSLADLMIKNAVETNWNVTPFEFIKQSEFQEFMSDTSLFFLMRLQESFPKESEPYGTFLVLLSPGEEKPETINDMNFHFRMIISTKDSDALYATNFYSLYIKAMHGVLLEKIGKKSTFFDKFNAFISEEIDNREKLSGTTLYINKGELSSKFDNSIVENQSGELVKIVDQDEIEDAISNDKDVAVTYLLNVTSKWESFSYKVLINAKSGYLYYYKRDKLFFGKSTGFSNGDIKGYISDCYGD